jgi:hypothetical protein
MGLRWKLLHLKSYPGPFPAARLGAGKGPALPLLPQCGRRSPPLVDRIGWERAFMALALGPVFGIVSMLRLQRLPEAARTAGGRR